MALASHQRVTRDSIPGVGVIFGWSLLLVLFSAPRGCSPGFPSSQKLTLLNSNSIWNARMFNTRALAQETGQPLKSWSLKI